jgi:flagellar basal body rod protein FlgG
VAKLGLADVNDPRRLVKVGGNVMTVDSPDALTAVSDKTVVRQGQVEESGVDPMVEMVAMLEGQRAFDANAKMITYQDTTLQQVNTIGRVA